MTRAASLSMAFCIAIDQRAEAAATTGLPKRS